MTTRALLSAMLATFASACATGTDDNSADGCFDGKCDDTNGGVCTDVRYGDGTRNTDIACAAPDIDCFRTFADDNEAAQWFAGLEAQLAAEGNRPQRPILSPQDPRHAKIRALVDRGWEAFKATRPVGKLAELRPGVILLDDPVVNAFAGGDPATGKSSLSVIVHTGALTTAASEEAVLGVIMHELQHAVGLHMLPGVKQKLVRYYVARGEEPIGRVQPNDPQVQALASDWLDAASEIGSYSTTALGGFPTGGTLSTVLTRVLLTGNQVNPQGCARSMALFNQLTTDFHASLHPLTRELQGDVGTILARTLELQIAAQTECLAGVNEDLILVLAGIANRTPAEVEAVMTQNDIALVKGKHVITGIVNLAVDRRTRMRNIEQAFHQRFGVPFTQVRYFSYEEDADDVSVPVMRASGMKATALADFFLVAAFQPADALTCIAQITSGQVPHYGADLADDHHSTCWRAYHINAVANWSERGSRLPEAAPVIPGYRIELPPTVSDMIID